VTPRIAGLLAVKNYRDDCSVWESLRALVDVTIVLDDNSTEPFPYRDECDEYLALRRPEPWNHLANYTTLVYRAFVHDCDWVVTVDDDIIYSANFQTRADVCRLVEEATQRGRDTIVFRLRDLWDSEHEYRCDGVWGGKGYMAVHRNWFFDERITLPRPSANRLHRPSRPVRAAARSWWRRPQPPAPHRWLREDYVAYHTGCLTRERRVERVEKYRREDPRNEYQADYGYMLRADGCELRPVPPGDLGLIRAKRHSTS